MSSHHLSRRDADRILDAPAESDPPSAARWRRCGAPGSADELRREDAAVAAFHAARLAPAPRTMSGMSRHPPRTAAVRAVAATGLVVALTSGGFALAATGHLPTLPDQASDPATEAVAQRTAPRRPSPSETATETPTATTPPTSSDPSPRRRHRRPPPPRRRRDPERHRVVGGGDDRPDPQPRRPLQGVPGQRQVGPRQGARQRRVHRAGHRGRRQGRHRDLLRGPGR